MRRASVLMETVIVMPVLLLLIFGLIQFAHIWTARQMVTYAAFCATRAIMVTRAAENGGSFEDGDETEGAGEGVDEQRDFAQMAAEVALSWINLADARNDDAVFVPGWGRVLGSGTSKERKRIETEILSRGDNANAQYAAVRVKFRFPLMIPGMAVNKVIANATHWIDSGEEPPAVAAGTGNFYQDLNAAAGTPILIDGWPYIVLEETCVLPMPYSTKNFPLRAIQERDAGEYDYARIDIRKAEGS